MGRRAEEPMRHSECSDHLNSAGSAHLVNFDNLCGVLQEMPAADAEDSPNLECYSAGVCALFRGVMWWWSAPMGRGGPFSPGRRGCSGAGSAPWSSSSAAPGGVGSAVPPRPASRRGGRRARFWRPRGVGAAPPPPRAPPQPRQKPTPPRAAGRRPPRRAPTPPAHSGGPRCAPPAPPRQRSSQSARTGPGSRLTRRPRRRIRPPGGTRRRAQKTGARTRTPTPANHSKPPPE